MKRTAKIVAIVLSVLLAGSAVASAAAGNLAADARGQAQAEADADARFGLDTVLELLGFVETQADGAADGEAEGEADGNSSADFDEELVSDIEIRGEAEAEAGAEKRVQAETPKAPEFPPKVELYGQAEQVFKMTAMADQTVVLDWDAGVIAKARESTSADIAGPGYTGSLDLVGAADAAGEASGHMEVSTHQVVVVMEKGEQLILSTEDEYNQSYRLAADAYGEVRDEAHVQVDETVRAYVHLKQEAKATVETQEEWAIRQAEFHKEVVLGLTGQVQAHAESTIESTTEAASQAEGSASAEAEATAEAAARTAGSANSGGDAHPPVCEL